MNRLEQYRDKRASEYADSPMDYSNIDDPEHDFKEGFNTALSLDMPIEFAKWQNSQRNKRTGLLNFPYTQMSWMTLYQHWLKNVFNPED